MCIHNHKFTMFIHSILAMRSGKRHLENVKSWSYCSILGSGEMVQPKKCATLLVDWVPSNHNRLLTKS